MSTPPASAPRLPIAAARLAIGLGSAAVMLTEVAFTRLASAALFYHYAFMAVALAMAGICLGSLMATLRPAATDDELARRIAVSGCWGSGGLLAWMGLIAWYRPGYDSLLDPLVFALGALPAMTSMGDVIARLLIHAGEDRPTMYAVDLTCSAAGALATIPLLGVLEGPGVLFAPALLLATIASVVRPASGVLRSASRLLLAACLAGAVWDAVQTGPLVTLRPSRGEP